MKAFFKGGAFFTLLCLLAKGIGALYRLPLTGIMGVEGIGLYQMVFPLYSVLLTVSAGGLPSAISKTVSQFLAGGDEENALRTLKVSLVTLTVAGLAGTALLVFLRGVIASLQGNPMAATAYLGIAPAVTFVAVISCLRGYFQGRLNMLPSGMSQLIEQLVKMGAGLALCGYLVRYGVQYGALGALLGVSISEFAAMAVLLLQYAAFERKRRARLIVPLKTRMETAGAVEAASDNSFEKADELAPCAAPPLPIKSLLRRIYSVALPITLGSLVLPLSSVIDSILVINLLTSMGQSVSLATQYYGVLNGPVGSLVNMPVVVTTSLSVMLLPKVSAIVRRGGDGAECAEKFLRISLLIALAAALVLGVFAREILGILYRRTMSPQLLDTGALLLRISSLSVIYMGILSPVAAVLQAHDRPHIPALNLLKGAALKAVLTIALLRIFGIAGASAATVACFALTCILDVRALRKSVRVRLKIGRLALCGAVAGGALVAAGRLLYPLLSRLLGATVGLIAALVLALAVYAVLVLALKGITVSELGEGLRGKKDG